MRAGSTAWSDLTMTNFNLLGVAAILSTIIATPVMAQPAGQALAQAAIQARGSYAIYHPNGESRLGPTPPRPTTTSSRRRSWRCQRDGISVVFPSIDART